MTLGDQDYATWYIQPEHPDEPTLEATRPAAQLVHVLDPKVEYVPNGHEELHEENPAAEYLPAAQPLQDDAAPMIDV